MGPVTIDIDPVILHVGHFSVQWYSVAIITAIIAGFYVALREAKRLLTEGFLELGGGGDVVSAPYHPGSEERMVVEFCAECGREPSKFCVIHPESGRPVRVCSNCERRLAETIVARQVKTGNRKQTWWPRL